MTFGASSVASTLFVGLDRAVLPYLDVQRLVDGRVPSAGCILENVNAVSLRQLAVGRARLCFFFRISRSMPTANARGPVSDLKVT